MSFPHGSDIEEGCTTITETTDAIQFPSYAIRIGALELIPEGRKLKSNRMSPYFFNSGLFTSGLSLRKLTEAYISVIRSASGLNFDVVFGPAYKGIPLATAVVYALGNDIGLAYNRKEEKDHGEGGILVGAPIEGKRVLIVDDVITSGTSLNEAVEIITVNGGIPVGCTIAFDRQEVGVDSDKSAVQEFEELHGIPVYSASKLSDLISLLQHTSSGGDEDDHYGEMLEMILAYQRTYGCTE